MNNFIEEKLKKLPDSPGVYIMHDANDEIIYVGKAKSLTKRVHQYFRASYDEGAKKKQMVQKIERFEYIECDSELEALVLECNLIKENRPKYNTMLRDDKTYPYIRVTLGEDYPRVLFSRRIEKDNSKYFGPFPSAGAVHETLELTQKLFSLRTCNRNFPKDFGKERPCLNFHMGACPGVCTGEVSKEEYKKSVDAALSFLNGNDKEVLKSLNEKMEEAAANMEFEKAAGYRDLIKSVKICMSRQKVTNFDNEDKDILAIAVSGPEGVVEEENAEVQDTPGAITDALVQIFFIRGGKMTGREHFFMNVREDDTVESVMRAFIQQYYMQAPLVPKELHLPFEINEKEMVEEWLTKKRGNKVRLVIPQRGEKSRMVEMAKKNAITVLTQDKERIKREEGRTIGAMKEIGDLLGLKGIMRMEAYDISNTNGFESVGSMVVFDKGKPKKNAYRKFKIKTVKGPDDYASMREVPTRRFTHGMEERKELEEKGLSENEGSFSIFPDIIMMDGGRGQVNIALEVLSQLGLSHIPVAGMVKDDHHRTRGLYYNNLEVAIDRHSESFKLITRLQDEAHRFAITFHKSLRGKAQVKSFLDDIEGIGPARRKALMRRFENIDALKEASVEEIAETDTMNMRAAQNVYSYLHGTEKQNEKK